MKAAAQDQSWPGTESRTNLILKLNQHSSEKCSVADSCDVPSWSRHLHHLGILRGHILWVLEKWSLLRDNDNGRNDRDDDIQGKGNSFLLGLSRLRRLMKMKVIIWIGMKLGIKWKLKSLCKGCWATSWSGWGMVLGSSSGWFWLIAWLGVILVTIIPFLISQLVVGVLSLLHLKNIVHESSVLPLPLVLAYQNFCWNCNPGGSFVNFEAIIHFGIWLTFVKTERGSFIFTGAATGLLRARLGWEVISWADLFLRLIEIFQILFCQIQSFGRNLSCFVILINQYSLANEVCHGVIFLDLSRGRSGLGFGT